MVLSDGLSHRKAQEAVTVASEGHSEPGCTFPGQILEILNFLSSCGRKEVRKSPFI